MLILVIEDDRTVGPYVADGLRREGHVVDLVADGRDGLVLATTGAHDLVVVDRLLPSLDGLALVRTLRAAGNRTPVLFLTAVDGVEDRITGLRAGGDDYLVKPFAFGELAARVEALARRPVLREEADTLRAADLALDTALRKVTRAGVAIDLLPRELALLEHLLRRKGRIQTRTMILEAVWDLRFDPQTNVVESHVSRLRATIERPFDGPGDRPMIRTVRGAGYVIDP